MTPTSPASEQSPESTCDDRFGLCPDCRSTDGYVNVGACHWFVCDAHKTKWPAGCGLFSSCQEEDEATWQKNAELLDTYTEVEPFRSPAPARAPAEYNREPVESGESDVLGFIGPEDPIEPLIADDGLPF